MLSKATRALENFILRDRYLLTCYKALQTFLKEKGQVKLYIWLKRLMITTRHMVIHLITTITGSRKQRGYIQDNVNS